MTIANVVQQQRWRGLENRNVSAAAAKVALDVANRLRQPAEVEAAVLQAKLQSKLPNGGPSWAPYGLAQGYAGLSLLFEQLDRCYPGEGWHSVAHQYLEIAAHGAAIQTNLIASAFGGLGGLAFATWYLSRSAARYQNLLETLDRNLITRVKATIANLRDFHGGVAVNVFDVVSGLSGLGAYLLCRLDLKEPKSTVIDLIHFLIELSEEEAGLPRWHTPPHLSSQDDFMLQQFPNGYLNCGLAHGIPGPLAVLSLAHLAGVRCEGLEDAIDRLATWLASHRLDDEWGENWPTGVGLSSPEEPDGRVAPVGRSPRAQAGWCYGSPGVSRSLYLAGIALQRAEFRDLALGAIQAVLRRPARARLITSPTFCHGVCGLLQIVMRFGNDTDSTTINAGAEILTKQLLDLYEPKSLLGFRSIELEGNRVDQPGLLDGATGVALVLIAAAYDLEPGWDRIFLLS
jgi:lantibiotic biosynthesis protein